jgi:hypothetical protein
VSTRATLILTDSLFAGCILIMTYGNEGFDKNPVFLNLLVIVAFASCIIRHINYYKLTKKIY